MAREATRRSFKYIPRTREAVMARTRSTGFDSYIKPQFKMFRPKDGKNVIRILPPTWTDADHYGYDIWLNYQVGVDNGTYLSLSKMKNERDPLLEARREAEREGDKKLADALTARRRVLMWVIDRAEEEEGPQLWPAPVTKVDKALANLARDEDTNAVLMIDDPDSGNDVRFYKEGQGKTTDYDASKMKLLKASPVCEDVGQWEEWSQFILENPIPDCLQFYDYEHINGVFNGQVGSRDEEAAVPTKPAAKRSVAEDMDDEIPEPVQKRTTLRPVEKEVNPPEDNSLSIRDRLRARRAQLNTAPDDDD